MELVLEPSRRGPPFCRLGAAHLHSPYDPVLEAERFLAASLGSRRPSHFVLLGPCLDYLSPLIKSRFPDSTIISLDFDEAFRGRGSGRADHSWYPESRLGIAAFLEALLDEDCAAGLAVLEWGPATQAFPAAAQAAREALRSALDRLSSSTASLRGWGRRWIANACRNFLFIEKPTSIEVGGAPIVVAAAGPSLAEALEELRPWRSQFLLFCVSSALAACANRGMRPDLVIATDAGGWSRFHLYPLVGEGTALASPLVALPTIGLSSGRPWVVLRQDNFPEPALAGLLGGGLPLPSHGTVSGTALRLAALVGGGPILVAGLDLACFDILSHARPHGFDPLHEDGMARLDPLETLLFGRELAAHPDPLETTPWRSSRSLALYTEAISRLGAGRALQPSPTEDRPDRGFFRLRPSPVDLEGFVPLTAGELPDFFAGRGAATIGFPALESPPLADRPALLRAALEGWRREAREACGLCARGVLPSSAQVKEMLRAVDLADWAAVLRALAGRLDAGPSALALERSTLDFFDDLERRLFQWTT
jgi:hypothetical protein